MDPWCLRHAGPVRTLGWGSVWTEGPALLTPGGDSGAPLWWLRHWHQNLPPPRGGTAALRGVSPPVRDGAPGTLGGHRLVSQCEWSCVDCARQLVPGTPRASPASSPHLPGLTRANSSRCPGRPGPGGQGVTHWLFRSGKTAGVCQHRQEPGALGALSRRQAGAVGEGARAGGGWVRWGMGAGERPGLGCGGGGGPLQSHSGPAQAPPPPSGQASLGAFCADLRIQAASKDFLRIWAKKSCDSFFPQILWVWQPPRCASPSASGLQFGEEKPNHRVPAGDSAPRRCRPSPGLSVRAGSPPRPKSPQTLPLVCDLPCCAILTCQCGVSGGGGTRPGCAWPRGPVPPRGCGPPVGAGGGQPSGGSCVLNPPPLVSQGPTSAADGPVPRAAAEPHAQVSRLVTNEPLTPFTAGLGAECPQRPAVVSAGVRGRESLFPRVPRARACPRHGSHEAGPGPASRLQQRQPAPAPSSPGGWAALGLRRQLPNDQLCRHVRGQAAGAGRGDSPDGIKLLPETTSHHQGDSDTWKAPLTVRESVVTDLCHSWSLTVSH